MSNIVTKINNDNVFLCKLKPYNRNKIVETIYAIKFSLHRNLMKLVKHKRNRNLLLVVSKRKEQQFRKLNKNNEITSPSLEVILQLHLLSVLTSHTE